MKDDDDELERAILLSLGVEDKKEEKLPNPTTAHVQVSDVSTSQFFTGCLLSNFIPGLSKEGNQNTISFTDILRIKNRPNVFPEKAVITSFGEDVQWIINEIGNKNCNLTIIRHYELDDSPGIHKITKNLTIIHPPILYSVPRLRGCFHCKLIMLMFPDRIRIAITTSNATPADYTSISQLIWIIDYPRRNISNVIIIEDEEQEAASAFTNVGSKKSNNLSPFVSDLQSFLYSIMQNARGIKEEFSNWINSIDDSQSENQARLVYSIPGIYQLSNKSDCSGLQMLNRKIKQCMPYFMNKSNTVGKTLAKMYAATSSIGKLEDKWLKRFPGCDNDSTLIEVLFPSSTSVAIANASGFSGEQFIIFSKHSFQSPKFPREKLREVKWANKFREPILSHIKMLIWTTSQDQPLAIYVGSHNLTASAWGFFEGRPPSERFLISNFELGVLIPPSDNINSSIPFQLPPSKYSENDQVWTNEPF